MIGFLHTAAAHVPTFADLLRRVDPQRPGLYAVEDGLLATAAAAGGVDAALAGQVAAAVEALRARGARVVVCTCSTIGDAAEAATRPDAPVLRIDRPMAEAAVRSGSRIAIVAALDTALAATAALVETVARETARSVTVHAARCPEAWPLFERGDREGYLAATAATARAAAAHADVVLLGQASMAGAAARLADLAVPVLASPELGVRAAVERCRALGA